MSRAFTKENDDRASGSVVDRFYQEVLGLSEPARDLIGRRQQAAWQARRNEIEGARRAAELALGDEAFREAFDSATQRAGDSPSSPTWWAIGDAAVAVASRRKLGEDQYLALIAPLSVALPWLKQASSQS
jgi:hypothetical protein